MSIFKMKFEFCVFPKLYIFIIIEQLTNNVHIFVRKKKCAGLLSTLIFELNVIVYIYYETWNSYLNVCLSKIVVLLFNPENHLQTIFLPKKIAYSLSYFFLSQHFYSSFFIAIAQSTMFNFCLFPLPNKVFLYFMQTINCNNIGFSYRIFYLALDFYYTKNEHQVFSRFRY